MAWEGLHIGDYECAPLLPGRAADSTAIGYMHAGHGTLEGTQQQLVSHHTVESRPPEVHGLVQQGSHVGHEGDGVGLAVGEALGLTQQEGVGVRLLKSGAVAMSAGIGKKLYGQMAVAGRVVDEIVLVKVLGTVEVG